MTEELWQLLAVYSLTARNFLDAGRIGERIDATTMLPRNVTKFDGTRLALQSDVVFRTPETGAPPQCALAQLPRIGGHTSGEHA